ncbi:fatty acid synthase alpha subunit Lsd1 [Coemansia brasiliensis]|uniref:Fatty acid synthase alpha subunit Lsd1 n=1 Tax=Coemansia brasiliensis TaxID=2650707 RepID=A0A9W8IGE6_9FUNG|nr:fatty acid synthase alpha subunit Lsd1 [Coemansia brasiliensis]
MSNLEKVEIVYKLTAVTISVTSDSADELRHLAHLFAELEPHDEISSLELYALFFQFCAQHNKHLALCILKSLIEILITNKQDIHVAIEKHNLDEGRSRAVLRAYYSLWNDTDARAEYQHAVEACGLPALFSSPAAHLLAIFGGQRGIGDPLNETQWLLSVYWPLLQEYVQHMSEFLHSESQDSRFCAVYSQGMDVFSWLTDLDLAPNAQYLETIPVMLPVVGLTQLMHVMILYKTLFMTPGQLMRQFKASTGHSQGIAIATVFSMLSDEASFEQQSRAILGLQMLVGAMPQIEYPFYMLNPRTAHDCAQLQESVPYPMALIQGISSSQLTRFISEFNNLQNSSLECVYLAVCNSSSQFIVAGVTASVAKFASFLCSQSEASDQSRVPFPLRKPAIKVSYLKITAPYHCSLLDHLVDQIYELAIKKGWTLDAADMQIPVRACDSGGDICVNEDLTRYLLYSMCVLPVNWPQAIADPGITHMVDFGTGGFNGFGQLAFKNVEGSGVSVICAGALIPHHGGMLGSKADLWKVKTAPNWLNEWGPRLVRTPSGIHIDTQMQRILGLPTVMVAGMTPTTTNVEFVAAISNAGYHVELAGGGMHSEQDMKDRIYKLAKLIPSGNGITLNCIYFNQKQWQFQFPALLQMRREGLPITGLCIGGGVPSTENAIEIISELQAASIRHIAFKPSTAESIRQVVQIAKRSPIPIILQWTGGRGGGHHSFEDFHQPILETYAAIRACKDMVLVAGSGFGDAQGSLPYITGEWSKQFGRAPMPFDGILLGSRVMIAKEAGTSLAAKELIKAAPGVNDSQWHLTYDGESGGVTTLTSEYGELNHSLANRATMFIRDMSSILSQPRDKREALLLARKDEIISRLNSDYMRPWFGKKANGQVVDLEDMTYTEVIDRTVELMYIKHQQRWAHKSFEKIVYEFIRRSECRFSSDTLSVSYSTWVADTVPIAYADKLAELYPEATSKLLTPDDVDFFTHLCKRRGQKPPLFILDFVDFGNWLQKDSIWPSENLETIVDQDPQRVGIQQGPVAAQYSTIVNESVKGIIDGIYHSHIDAIVERLYNSDESQIPFVEYLGPDPVLVNLPSIVNVSQDSCKRTFTLPVSSVLPDTNVWLQALAGSCKSWLHAWLTAPAVVQGHRFINNQLRQLLRPRPGRTFVVQLADGIPNILEIYSKSGELEFKLEYSKDIISQRVFQPTQNGVATFLQKFLYCPASFPTPISHLEEIYNASAHQVNAEAWVDNSDHPVAYTDIISLQQVVYSNGITLTEDYVRAFCLNIGNRLQHYVTKEGGHMYAPIDFVYVAGTPFSLQLLISPATGDGQLAIVHLTNSIELADDMQLLKVGDFLRTAQKIDSIANTALGKVISISTHAYVGSQLIAKTKSEFLSKGYFIDFADAFKRDSDQLIVISLPSEIDVAALEMKEWFIYREDTPLTLGVGAVLEFQLDSTYRYKQESLFASLSVTGKAMLIPECGLPIHIADVDFQWLEARSNFVIDYLRQFEIAPETSHFDYGGYKLDSSRSDIMTIVVPDSNHEYARLSGDRNPIHVNPYIADIAGLPATITHGQWTNAATRTIVERCVADEHPERIRQFATEYVGMVVPRDTLYVELSHVGMKRGQMLFEGQTLHRDGSPVMKFTAQVEQPATVYVFTGQGAQYKNMGMDMYQSSSVAKSIWDRANEHMVRKFGLPLLDIVCSNPSEHTMHFEGDSGEAILDNYLDLKALLSESPLSAYLCEIDEESLCYTLTSPNGLLNTTQITQPALMAFAWATVADMKNKGLVQHSAMFAGHSLGELCALGTLGNFLQFEDMLELAFYRGLVMQSAVSRDEHGYSGFGMVAVNPARIGSTFDESMLFTTLSAIQVENDGLLDIVNYNVRKQQYVVAGTLFNLEMLRQVLDALASAEPTFGTDSFEPMLRTVIDNMTPISAKPVLLRGIATVPLDGIDMPFHSRILESSVPMFRKILRTKILPDKVHLDALYNRYIPNLTAVPFAATREYVELVHTVTRSPVLAEILENYSTEFESTCAHETAVALLIEILAYQLASPVQWIRTLDQLFNVSKVERMIEIGPSPVLCNLAARSQHNGSKLWHCERDKRDIYFMYEAEGDSKPIDLAAGDASNHKSAQLQLEPVISSPETQSVSEQTKIATAESLKDVPIPTVDAIRAIIASKTKQPLENIPVNQSIKALSSGKSIMQNELLGELQKEFGSKMPDKSEELPINELSESIGKTVLTLGKCTQSLVSRLFSNKMPGGYSLKTVREKLQSLYGLGHQRQDALLLHALTIEPKSRLSSDDEANAWLDKVARSYAIHAGINYQAATAVLKAGSQVSVVSSVELQKMRKRELEHIKLQIQVLARYAGIDMRSGDRIAEQTQMRLEEAQKNYNTVAAEFGDMFVSGVHPQLDIRKARYYDSYWNWARQNAYELVQYAISFGTKDIPENVSVKEQMLQLQNCADEELVQMLMGMQALLGQSSILETTPALQFVQTLYRNCKNAIHQNPVYRELTVPKQPKTTITADGEAVYHEIDRASEPSFAEYIATIRAAATSNIPLLSLSVKSKQGLWQYDSSVSALYFDALASIVCQGLTFTGRTALITGCGQGSIGIEILRGLLIGGAKVVATTSRYSHQTIKLYETLYRECGSRGSQLIVVPFNQGSVQDIDGLVNFIFSQEGLGWDLDYVFPFAAISDIGSTATNLGSRSELAQRVILTNVLRLLGGIKAAKDQYRKTTGRPTLAVLPLSPNHGIFGGDGLYGECKLALETLFNRWKSEAWKGNLSVVGAVIGWTRGTGLMSDNNLLAQKIESKGVRTFSPREMAFNILGLLHKHITRMAHRQPLRVDMSGGLSFFGNISQVVKDERMRIDKHCALLKRIVQDISSILSSQYYVNGKSLLGSQDIGLLAKPQIHFPSSKSYCDLEHLHYLQDMIDLDQVVVITGYGEVGPYGNAETRWEVEAFGELSNEGCIELAWIMGLIKYHNGNHPTTKSYYVGWTDSKSGEPVRDMEVKQRYEKFIMAHTGIRLIEPELVNGYNPNDKRVLREIQIEHDMEPFEASTEEAAAYKSSNGNKVDIWESKEHRGLWLVRFLKGAVIRVPAAVTNGRLVASLLPTGWEASRFGIPNEIVSQLDHASLLMLVSVVEALIRSGITDPYELYKYVHISEIGSSLGSGIGGSSAVQDVFGNRQLDKSVKADIIQEIFISTIQAWINMLLISGSGPVRPAVGACATGVLSIDSAMEAIQQGKAKVMLAGGVDTFTDESSTEFAKMGATSDSVQELSSGREPSEMCRPCTSTRNGFMEGEGGGAVVLMSASLAIEIGAPIYGVVAFTSTATDKQGRSVPAPGKGILTSSRETTKRSSLLLDMEYRRRKLQSQLKLLDSWREAEIGEIQLDRNDNDTAFAVRDIETAYYQQKRALLDVWSHQFWKHNAEISPLRGSLAVWGLTVDDIGMASFHGTSTKANDKNESDVLNSQLKHLGRTPGHAVPVVCQKWLTGHAKGGAASFMLNGVLQSLRTGLIPGNRNADNIASELQECDNLVYLSKSIQTTGIKAALMKSFGFGQVGGEMLVLHPDFALAAMTQQQLDEYNQKVDQRRQQSLRYWQEAMVGKRPFVKVKERPPFTEQQEQAVYLDPLARAHWDPVTKEYKF